MAWVRVQSDCGRLFCRATLTQFSQPEAQVHIRFTSGSHQIHIRFSSYHVRYTPVSHQTWPRGQSVRFLT
eukprot:6555075-Lingulodinium_polyedra.AAC.1